VTFGAERRDCGLKTDGGFLTVLFSLVISAIYWSSIRLIQSEYLNTRGVDALAVLHSFSPLCYVAILSFAILCFSCLILGERRRYVHILLLAQFSIMLWLTPYCLSGFSRTSNSLWHAGIAKNVADIGTSGRMMFSSYYEEYPVSFILNFVEMRVSNIDLFVYAQLVYPLFCTISVTLLLYVLISRLFSSRTAFISTMIATLGPAVPEVHVSPHSLGIVLVLCSSIFLLTFRNRGARATGLLTSLTLVTIHPISPLITVVFILGDWIAGAFADPLKMPRLGRGVIAILCGWLGWAMFVASRTEANIAESLYNVLTFNFAVQLEMLGRKATHSVGYLFPEISLIGKMVSYGYLVVPLMLLVVTILRLKFPVSFKDLLLQVARRINHANRTMLSVAFLCAVVAIGLVFSSVESARERSFYLWERSYQYFVLAVSAYMGSSVVAGISSSSRRIRGFARVVTICCLITLVMIYPVTHSESESYDLYPPSEGSGMKFLQSNVELNKKYVAILFASQLASYLEPGTEFRLRYQDAHMQLLSELTSGIAYPFPDVISFRRTEYFYASMVYDKSFENNRFSSAVVKVEGSSELNKIYSNPSFDVYVKGH
jgi:hypothetical protein